MNRTVAVVSFLVAVFALVITANFHCTLWERLLSLIIQACPLICGVLDACFRLALFLRPVGELDLRSTGRANELLRRAVRFDLDALMFSEMSDLPEYMIPHIVADNMISILDEYDTAASAREAATFRRRLAISGLTGILDLSVAGVIGSEPHAWTDGAGFDGVPLMHGFLRRPYIVSIGRPPTAAADVYGYTLDLIRRIDAVGCLLRLRCEMGAQPTHHRKHQVRMAQFLRHVGSIAGVDSTAMRRYDAAFKMGRRQFRGNSSMCATAFEKCS
ncbi:uncharacterized protein [Dermacentor albipictus]|uniref:uncharacterized protein n=1 Tax=Dermacentor albipictus TaxID=60249 RepID=UPI0031FD1046